MIWVYSLIQGTEGVIIEPATLGLYGNVLFLTFENEISGIIYGLFRDGQNIFLTIFNT